MEKTMPDVSPEEYLTKDFLVKINDVLGKASTYLKKPLPSHGPDLIKQMSEVDAYSFTIIHYTSILREHLTKLEYELLPKKDFGSVQERILKMKSDTAKIRSVIEILEGTYEAIKRKITLGQSILKWETENRMNRV
jgi:hypothetical protein